ncbi:MAG: hypothetical protein ACLQVI_03785 [Polyangiaceae bacterium]
MSLSTLLDQLKKTLSNAQTERTYSQARSRHRALQPYESIGALVAVTARGSSIFAIDREAILAAIVAELQLSPERLWQPLLLVAFTPMLIRIRASLGRPGSEDLDQSVLLAFLEAARSPVCRSYVARNLRLLTQARLFAERRREHRAVELLVFDEETHPCDLFGEDAAGSTCEARSAPKAHHQAAAAELVRIIEAEGGEELRELLLTTYGDDDSVREFVDRAYADSDDVVRARASKRLRRARKQVFAKLRARAARREKESVLATPAF